MEALLTGPNGPFPGEVDPAIVGFDANPDGDNESNVFELWRGTDPGGIDVPKPATFGTIVVDGTRRATVTVEVVPAIDDLFTIDANFSFDLQNWRRATANRTVLSESNGVRRVRFHDTVELPEGQGYSVRFSADPSN